MGNEVAEVVEGLPSARAIKVHVRMCSELQKLLMEVNKIFPEIEAARPRCSSGIDALCMLNNGIVKGKSLIQHCSESSVLYLALTGEAIVSRCKKSKNLLEQSLQQIQSMVPVMLAAKISGIFTDLRNTSFRLDPAEEESGKILRELLHKYGSTFDSSEQIALSAIQSVSSLLKITTQKALLIEKRSIRKLLERIGDSEPSKRKILKFFLGLLNKYGKILTKEQIENEDSISNPYSFSGEIDLCLNYGSDQTRISMLGRPVPPEEFICPLTSRLMYDPVVISSGQTFERTWIQKWFDAGNEICPKTKMKLDHLSYTSNTGMKDLIVKWCVTHNISIPDPNIPEKLQYRSWESSTNSIASLGSSMNDLNFPLDFSNVSIGSSKMGSYVKEKSHEINLNFISEFGLLSWDARCDALEDVKILLKDNDESWSIVPFDKLVDLVLGFTKDARDLDDVEAQVSGFRLLLDIVKKNRNSKSYMKEDAYSLLSSFLDTELAKEALAILDELSSHQNSDYKIVESDALISISNILDIKIQELLEPALKILTNLSSNPNLSPLIEFIPKLVPLFDEDTILAGYCITILKNLCEVEGARISIAETDNCIASIVKMLENESRKGQENAVSILLSLCSQRVVYCQLVLSEGVIPGLCNLSINGNEKARAMAMELLRILKEETNSTNGESSGSEVITGPIERAVDKSPPAKSQGLFGKFFSKKKK